jgi:hypothetical protein
LLPSRTEAPRPAYFYRPFESSHVSRLAIVIVEKTIAVECSYEILQILKTERKESRDPEQHDSAVKFAWKEVTREYGPFRRFTQPTGLLDGESKRLNELPGPNGGVIVHVVFKKGIIDKFVRAAFDGLLKLDFNASPKSVVDLSSPSSLYST